MKTIKIIAGGLGLMMSATSFGLGYDSAGDDKPTGARASEVHGVQFTTRLSDCPDPAVCAAAASGDSEFTAILEVQNLSTCASPTGTCTPATAVDNYVGDLGTAVSGVAPASPYTNIFLPACPVGAAACLRDLPLSSTFYDWDFTTDANGKIVSGHAIADSTFATSGTVGVFVWPEKVIRTYRGDASTGLATQAAVDCAVDLSQDFTTCWIDDAATPADGPSAEQDFEYVTYPESTGDLTKTVPVPAFAAALLGLGLVAITVMTGRRRQIK